MLYTPPPPGSILAKILATLSLARVPSLLAVATRVRGPFRVYPIYLLAPLVPTVIDCARVKGLLVVLPGGLPYWAIRLHLSQLDLCKPVATIGPSRGAVFLSMHIDFS